MGSASLLTGSLKRWALMSPHDQSDHVPEWYEQNVHSPYNRYDSEVVKDIQRTLMCPETGVWDDATVVHLRGLQALFGIPQTGRMDEQSAIQIERLRNRYAVQE